MELKPRAVTLVRYEEELTSSGRKILHCIFKNRFGDADYHYRWTPPWRSKAGKEVGVEQLFLKALDIETWNDPDGAWSEELMEASKEIPALEEMKPVVKISILELAEDLKQRTDLVKEYWRVCVHIDSDDYSVIQQTEGDQDYLTIGNVKMLWDLLKQELSHIKGIHFISKRLKQAQTEYEYPNGYVDAPGVEFQIWVEKVGERTKYRILSREIVSRISSFIRHRMSEYKEFKKGFDEQGQ